MRHYTPCAYDNTKHVYIGIYTWWFSGAGLKLPKLSLKIPTKIMEKNSGQEVLSKKNCPRHSDYGLKSIIDYLSYVAWTESIQQTRCESDRTPFRRVPVYLIVSDKCQTRSAPTLDFRLRLFFVTELFANSFLEREYSR